MQRMKRLLGRWVKEQGEGSRNGCACGGNLSHLLLRSGLSLPLTTNSTTSPRALCERNQLNHLAVAASQVQGASLVLSFSLTQLFFSLLTIATSPRQSERDGLQGHHTDLNSTRTYEQWG